VMRHNWSSSILVKRHCKKDVDSTIVKVCDGITCADMRKA